jgi:hypothetical protein
MLKTIYWLCIYHCERIHSGISKNLRQKWQRFGKLWFDEMFRKRTILLIMSIPWWEDSQWYIHKTDSDKNITDSALYWYWYVHTTVRGFTVVYHQTYVRFGRGLPGLMRGRWKIEEKSRYMLHVTCYMLRVTCYVLHVLYNTNIYIPLWEDSQWYAIKTYVRSGRGLPGFDTGEMEIGGTCY